MRPVKLLVLCLFLFAISSCTAHIAREQSNSWLDSKMGKPGINMTGTWDSGGVATGGWGDGNFIQKNGRFSGSLGLYYVDGVVNGDDIYMSISSGQRVYYTAHLKKTGEGNLTGQAVEGAVIDSPEAGRSKSYLITLKKTS